MRHLLTTTVILGIIGIYSNPAAYAQENPHETVRPFPAQRLILNNRDRPGDMVVQFGQTANERLSWDATNALFVLTDDLKVQGKLMLEELSNGGLLYANNGTIESVPGAIFDGDTFQISQHAADVAAFRLLMQSEDGGYALEVRRADDQTVRAYISQDGSTLGLWDQETENTQAIGLRDGNFQFSRGIQILSLPPARALISDGSSVIGASQVTAQELGFLSGVTSPLQAQIDNLRHSSAPSDVTGPITVRQDYVVPEGDTKVVMRFRDSRGKVLSDIAASSEEGSMEIRGVEPTNDPNVYRQVSGLIFSVDGSTSVYTKRGQLESVNAGSVLSWGDSNGKPAIGFFGSPAIAQVTHGPNLSTEQKNALMWQWLHQVGFFRELSQ